MTVEEVARKTESQIIVGGAEGMSAEGVYAGDFLSRVMGRAPRACVWLTVMSNVNVAGVAVLADIAAIVLCEGVEPDKQLIAKCEDENIALLKTSRTVYECCRTL